MTDNAKRGMETMRETLRMCGALDAGCPEPTEHNISEIKQWLETHELIEK